MCSVITAQPLPRLSAFISVFCFTFHLNSVLPHQSSSYPEPTAAFLTAGSFFSRRKSLSLFFCGTHQLTDKPQVLELDTCRFMQSRIGVIPTFDLLHLRCPYREPVRSHRQGRRIPKSHFVHAKISFELL